MTKGMKLFVSVALAFTLMSAAMAFAAPDFDDGVIDSGKEVHGHQHGQHGGTTGHIDVENYGVELVSKLGLKNVEPEKIADVGVHEGYAYLAAWGVVTCKYNGVHVVDVRDPASPREVSFIPSKEGSYPGEGVQALSIDTPQFNGDILVTNNEKCTNTDHGFGGMNIYDVSRPTAPTPLYEGFGDTTAMGTGKQDAHEIHSVFAWDAGTKAYAVMVDNEEFPDVDIVDITNPKKPSMVAEFDLNTRYPQIIQDDLGSGESFLHDMIVKNIDGHWYMLVSYWDGGYVVLNVDDPANPRYVADNDFTNPDPELAESGYTMPPEGNAHQAEFSKNNNWIIAADEDFAPYSGTATHSTVGEFDNTMGIAIEPGSTLTGTLRLVGRGCDVDGALPAPAAGDIALIERGACTFTEKVGNASDAGYAAAVVFNSQAAVGGTCTGLVNMSVTGNIPALFVGRDTAFAFMGLPYDNAACEDGDATTGAVPAGNVGNTFGSITVTSEFDGWGYVHLFKNGTGKLREVDTYAIPEAHDEAFAFDHGDLSVHEIAMSEQRDDLGYLSYYAGGLRVIQVGNRGITERGAFIDDGGNNFWGVQVFQHQGQEYVAASDRDFGLYIFKYTGK